MAKVLNTYRIAPTFKNAQKVHAYERTHPMARAVLSREDMDLLIDAICHANIGT
jgi:hypothetical protein